MSTSTVADLAPILAFLAEHPDLPLSETCLTLYGNLGGLGPQVGMFNATPEQVGAWAAALGVVVRVRHLGGHVHHSADSSTPFRASVVAILPAEVSA